MQRIVVIGTGTHVGKTHVAAALATSVRLRWPRAHVIALKPVETGFGRGGGDAARLASALQLPVVPPRYAFEPPISPHLAAARAGTSIEIPALVAWIHDAEKHTDTTSRVMHCVSIIETAGGVLSPLSRSATNFDLARALEPAKWVLVAPDALGVLHDVSATLGALERLGRRPDHVVLSAARDVDESTGTNAAELAALGIVEPSAIFGRDQTVGLDALVDRLLAGSSLQA